VRVYYKKQTFKPVAKFSTWIYTIASNLAKTRLRQRDRQKLFSFFQKQCPEEEFEIADKKYDLDRITDAIMVEEIVQNALTQIPKKYREAVVLRDIQDMTYEDIATILHTNSGTVKSRINRGRALLKELLKNYKF
jgi:RNA polymerase sigma-70 factor (ECF subfamily)